MCSPCKIDSSPLVHLYTFDNPSCIDDILVIELFTRLRDHLWLLPAACLMLEKNAVFLSCNKTNQCRLGVICSNSKREEPEIILFMIMKKAVGLLKVEQMKASDA